MLIDTHAHLFFEDFGDDLEQVIAQAKVAGLTKVIVPGTSSETSRQAIELAKKYPGFIYAAVGVHPEEILSTNYNEETPFACRRALLDLQLGIPFRESPREIVAIGEIGIDLYTEEMRVKLAQQKELFKSQCLVALEADLPVVIHTRNSFAEVWEVLTALPKMPRGQFHCFSVDEEALSRVVGEGFNVSFGGNITWSKRVARLVPMVPDNRLLLETDSPLLVPRDKEGEPINGSVRNEPANVAYLSAKIAELRGKEVGEIAEITTENAKTLFKL
jgi:TatD DNase family protein